MLNPRTLLATSLSVCALGSLALVTGAALWLSAPCSAPPVEPNFELTESHPILSVTESTFPRAFVGNFTWDSDTQGMDHQTTRLRVEEVNQRGNLIVATGRGLVDFTHYDDKPTSFDFRMEVDVMTGEFEMWESNPSVTTNYVTEGKYTATLTSGSYMGFVNATWEGDNGEDGRLVLNKVHSPCKGR